MGKNVKSLEATKVSDEEYREENCTSAVGSISEKNAKYTEILKNQNNRWLIW